MTICAIEGCENQAGLPGSARGWCHSHYRRWRRCGDPLGARQRITSCIIDGCGKPPKGRGWCAAHYSRWQRHGDPLARLAGEVVDGCRICPTCDRDLPLEKYTPNTTGECRECCAATARRRRQVNPPEPRGRQVEAICPNCGVGFIADGRRSKYCSRDCFVARRYQDNWKNVVVRRVKERAAVVERFTREEIFERDDWTCQICHEPIDRAAKKPNMMCASVDHIVPISKGGAHSRANVQAAHLRCNVRKGDRIESGVAS